MNTRKRLGTTALAASVVVGVSSASLLGARAQVRERREKKTVMTSTIAFVSTRHGPPPGGQAPRAQRVPELGRGP